MNAAELRRSLAEATRKFREHNDCTVRALAATTGVSYAEVLTELARLGRRPRRRTAIANMIKAARVLGFDMTRLERDEYVAKTIRGAPKDRRLLRGTYVLSVRGHVAAMVDGQVIDWADGRRHRLHNVYRIVRREPEVIEPKRVAPREAPRSQMWLFPVKEAA